jgi:hypothetical protein
MQWPGSRAPSKQVDSEHMNPSMPMFVQDVPDWSNDEQSPGDSAFSRSSDASQTALEKGGGQ